MARLPLQLRGLADTPKQHRLWVKAAFLTDFFKRKEGALFHVAARGFIARRG
jgi:hypothetical protein